jgi:5-hydroxyisourate hydrolase
MDLWMSRISTHVLDVSLGKPAKDVSVRLERREHSGAWVALFSSRTGVDGRCAQLLPANESLCPGVYRLNFDTASYFQAQEIATFYPLIELTFQVLEGESEFHIPLLLSPHGYTTYRGS